VDEERKGEGEEGEEGKGERRGRRVRRKIKMCIYILNMYNCNYKYMCKNNSNYVHK